MTPDALMAIPWALRRLGLKPLTCLPEERRLCRQQGGKTKEQGDDGTDTTQRIITEYRY
jgi:hypothetical protein